MMSYGIFASYYDELTRNVDYKAYAARLDELILSVTHRRGFLIDLGCGTGSLTFELEKLGYSVTGIDLSCEMLSEAYDKKISLGSDAVFVNQDMTRMNLPYKADAVVCSLDALNHLDSFESVEKTFSAVRKNLAPDGVFIFDMNTPYKHEYVLGDNAFNFETDNVFVAWQNDYEASDCSVEITLDFFVPQEDGLYARYTEQFREKAYESDDVVTLLEKCGFVIRGMYDELSEEAPHGKTQRILYCAGLSPAKRRK